MNEPAGYQIQVKGHLGEEWSEWMGGMSIVLQEDGTSLLTGLVIDQAALQGLLLKLHDMGLPLVSVQRVEQPTRRENE